MTKKRLPLWAILEIQLWRWALRFGWNWGVWRSWLYRKRIPVLADFLDGDYEDHINELWPHKPDPKRNPCDF